jgi:hypothetical protein
MQDDSVLNEPIETEFHEVPSHNEEEDTSLFEIHDFSTASDWEKYFHSHDLLTLKIN